MQICGHDENSSTPEEMPEPVEPVISDQEQDTQTPDKVAPTASDDCDTQDGPANSPVAALRSPHTNFGEQESDVHVDHAGSLVQGPHNPEQIEPADDSQSPVETQENGGEDITRSSDAVSNAEQIESTTAEETPAENHELPEEPQPSTAEMIANIESEHVTSISPEGDHASSEQSESKEAAELNTVGSEIEEPREEKCEETADDDDDDDDLRETTDDDQDDEESDYDDQEEETIDELEGVVAGLPDYIVRRLNRLKTLDRKRDAYMGEYLKERAALEVKYATMCDKLFQERAEIINGHRDEEIARVKSKKFDGSTAADASSKEEKKEDEAAVEAGDIREELGLDTDASADEPRAKGIPQFWVCAMGHMEVVGSMITEGDVECLEYIENITCVDDNDGKGFTLTFSFAPNPFFENETLIKRYEVPNLMFGDEPVLKNVTGCKMRWKPDQSLTYDVIKKKQRGKGKHAGQVRTVTKKERKESMFHWFDPPAMPSIEDTDEEEVQKLEEFFDHDYDVAQAFRMHIIPKAFHWFTGQAAQQELEEAVDEVIGAN